MNLFSHMKLNSGDQKDGSFAVKSSRRSSRGPDFGFEHLSRKSNFFLFLDSMGIFTCGICTMTHLQIKIKIRFANYPGIKNLGLSSRFESAFFPL